MSEIEFNDAIDSAPGDESVSSDMPAESFTNEHITNEDHTNTDSSSADSVASTVVDSLDSASSEALNTKIVEGTDLHPKTVVKILAAIFLLLFLLLIAVFVSVQRKQTRAREQLSSMQLVVSPDGLVDAVLAQDATLVKRFLDAGIDRDFPSLRGWSPLAAAASRGDKAILELLINRGARVDGPNSILLPQAQTRLVADERTAHMPTPLRQNCMLSGSPPIVAAAVFGRMDGLQALLSHGASVDQETPTGWSALMCAVAANQLPIVNALISQGAALTHESKDANTPLAVALDTGNRTIVSALLERGADIDAIDSKGKTLLARLSANPQADLSLASMLMEKGVDVNRSDYNGKTPLHYSLEAGNLEYIKLLLAKGASVDTISKNGNTPLMFAAQGGNPEIVSLLISENENLNRHNFQGKTAWEIAEANGKLEVLPLLHPEYQLYAAIAGQNLEFARRALAHGAEINISDVQGISPLILALSDGRPNLTKFLLRTETDPNYVAGRGQKVMLANNRSLSRQADSVIALLDRFRAAKSSSQTIPNPRLEDSIFDELASPPTIVTRMMDKTGAPLPPSSMRSVFRSGKTELLQLLLLGGARVDMPDTDGNTPLLYAVQAGDIDHIELLLKNNADYERQNDAGLSPLLHAVNLRRADIAERMLRTHPLRDKGANAEAVLLAAAIGGLHGVVESFLQQGVNPRVSDRAGRDLVFLAVARGDYKLAELLFQHGAILSFEDHNVRALYVNAKHDGKRRLVQFLEQHGAEKQLLESSDMKRDEKVILDQLDGPQRTNVRRPKK